MRLSSILILFALSLIFENTSAQWAAVARGIEPIILSIGSAFAAFSLYDELSDDVHVYDKKGWSIWSKRKAKVTQEDMDEDMEKFKQEIKEEKENARYQKEAEKKLKEKAMKKGWSEY